MMLQSSNGATITLNTEEKGVENKAKEEEVTRKYLFVSLMLEKSSYEQHKLLPSGSVQSGLPVNLCADLTSCSPKNAKTLHLKHLHCCY